MLKTLQAGRAIAALAVVAFHLSLVMGAANFYRVATFGTWTFRGDLGVDFFFVLSGFIIMKAHWKDVGARDRIGRYAYRRVTRIYPIYWALTAVLLVLSIAHITSGDRPPSTAVGWLTDFSLIRFSSIQPPIHPAWTLFHEMAFYAIFGLLLISRRLGLAALAIWFVGNLIHLQYPTPPDRTPLNVYLSGFNLNFFIGMAAYGLYRTGRIHIIWAPVGIAALIGQMVAQAHGAPIHPLAYALTLGLIICACATSEEAGGLAVPRFLVFLGDASYTIYLTHEAAMGRILQLLIKVKAARLIHLEGVYVTAFVLTVAIGCGAYLVIEKPLNALFRPKPKPPSP